MAENDMTETEKFFEAAGGTAFPYVAEGGSDSGLHAELRPGMTLRDWFAGQALAGHLAWGSDGEKADELAKGAYLVADAMLKERTRG